MATGKQIKSSKEKVDRNLTYQVDEALALVKETSFAKFDESVDVSIKLGVDPRKADQMVRGAVVLPNGLGKQSGFWSLPRARRHWKLSRQERIMSVVMTWLKRSRVAGLISILPSLLQI